MSNKPFECAEWIWHSGESVWNETTDYTADFTATDPAKCRICVSVNSHYALYINGKFVVNDQFPDFDYYKVYDELCLANAVKPGKNTLVLTVYWQGDESLTYHPYPVGAAFAVFEGDTPLVGSNGDTLCRRNTCYAAEGVEKITGQLSYSFRYDVTAALPAWENARVLQRDWPLHRRPIRKLCLDAREPVEIAALGHFKDTVTQGTAADRMQAAALSNTHAPEMHPVLDGNNPIEVDDNFILLDLGKEQVGYFDLEIKLPKACDVLIGWGEHLDDLHVRTAVGTRNFAAVYHGKAGLNKFFYPFKRMGLRYIQLHVYASHFTLYYAGVHIARYPVARTNLFTCADHLSSQIYRTGLRTLQHCMHDHYEDCPWREQALYSMDSRNQMLCGYYAFEEYEFAKASLRMLGLSLQEDGLLELTAPGKTRITIPSFTAIYLIQLGEYLHFSGDVAFIREMLPYATKIARGFMARTEENGLIRRLNGERYWNFYEWQEGLAGLCGAEKPKDQQAFDAPLNAFVSMAYEQMALMNARLGNEQEAARYTAARAALNEAIDRTYWQEEKGYYATELENGVLAPHACELTQSLAVCCGAVPEYRLDRVLETLTGEMGADFYAVTLSHSIFKYEALLKRPTKYARLVFDQLADCFGNMLYRNATTFWETAEGSSAFGSAGSLCHAWSAIPVYLYLRYCADLRGEGVRLPEKLTGLYEVAVQRFTDASRRITDDNWK